MSELPWLRFLKERRSVSGGIPDDCNPCVGYDVYRHSGDKARTDKQELWVTDRQQRDWAKTRATRAHRTLLTSSPVRWSSCQSHSASGDAFAWRPSEASTSGRFPSGSAKSRGRSECWSDGPSAGRECPRRKENEKVRAESKGICGRINSKKKATERESCAKGEAVTGPKATKHAKVPPNSIYILVH